MAWGCTADSLQNISLPLHRLSFLSAHTTTWHAFNVSITLNKLMAIGLYIWNLDDACCMRDLQRNEITFFFFFTSFYSQGQLSVRYLPWVLCRDMHTKCFYQSGLVARTDPPWGRARLARSRNTAWGKILYEEVRVCPLWMSLHIGSSTNASWLLSTWGATHVYTQLLN